MRNTALRHGRGWIGVAVWIILVQGGAVALAGQAAGTEERIRDAALRVDQIVTPLGEAAAVRRLATAFRVPPRVVAELHDHKLDFGEVAVVLALADVGRTSPDTVLGLWASGRLNWGEIAGRLKVDLPGLLRRLEVARRDLGSPAR